MQNNIECYSVRQVSPFVGSIQIIQADYCRALSSDGSNWQIQASCETHQQIWNIAEDEYIPRRYVLYGSWNQSSEFSSLPLDPMLDVPSLDHIQNTLINTIESSVGQLPLPQKDFYECWLLDSKTQHPLALIATATEQAMLPHIQITHWQAISQQDDINTIPDLNQDEIDRLESLINELGVKPTWFLRRPGESTINLSNNISIDNDQFPELLINRQLLPETLHDLFERYTSWLSPRLLTLNSLMPATRDELEQMAQHYALETRKRLSIYPQPLNHKIHNKIMVELKLRDL